MSSSYPRAYDNYTYYGRGPINNYGDRKASQYIEQHKSKVILTEGMRLILRELILTRSLVHRERSAIGSL